MLQIRSFFKRHTVGIFVFLLLICDFFLRCPDGFSGWAPTWYALDYSLGTGSRLLIGSLLHLLKGGAVTASAAVKFAKLCTVVMIALFSLLMDQFARESEKERRLPVLYLIALLTVAPFSIRYLWNEANFGRLDLYLVGLLLLALVLTLQMKRPALRAGVICALSVVALLIHQVFFFIFFPVLLSTLILDAWDGGAVTVKKLLPGLACCVLVGGFFLYVQLFSTINAASADALTAALKATTDLDISHSALDFEYFHDVIYGFQNHMLPFLSGGTVLIKLFITLLLLLPAGLIYGFLWNGIRRERQSLKKSAFAAPYSYLALSALLYLPPFLLTVDWNRWVAAFFLSAGLVLLLLNYREDGAAERAFSGLDAAIRRRPIPFSAALFYLAALSPLRAREFLPEVETLLQTVRKILQ